MKKTGSGDGFQMLRFGDFHGKGGGMGPHLLLAALLTMCLLAGSFIAFFPLKERVTRENQLHFYFAYAALSLCLFVSALLTFERTSAPLVFKWYFLWSPFLRIYVSYKTLGRPFVEQLFCYSMAALVTTVTHTTASFLHDFELSCGMVDPTDPLLLLSLHCLNFLLILAAAMPFLYRLLRNLMPPERFFRYQRLGVYLTLLPFAAVIGTSFQFYDNELFHDTPERLSRLVLLILLFFIYRMILIYGGHLSRDVHRENQRRELALQQAAIEDAAQRMEEHKRTLSILRHDMRHYDTMLAGLLVDGKTEEAQALIEKHTATVDLTKVKAYCSEPLVNAVLSVHFQRIEESGIPLTQRIGLGETRQGSAADIALLLANLVENAYQASLKQPADRRGIEVRLESRGEAHVLKVENRYDGEPFLGPDGLPQTAVPGHGVGTESLRRFMEKYHARATFHCEAGRVRCLVYWNS